jgi:D-lactate dehydrogenase
VTKLAVFSTKPFDRSSLEEANRDFGHELFFFETHLCAQTTPLARGFPAVCIFVNDQLDETALRALNECGTKAVCLRCAGFNNVDLRVAAELGLTIVRVPAYSPYAVAEHTVGLILALNRKLHRAFARVRDHNFELMGLLGFDLHGRTVGVVGTGKIGSVVTRIMIGFGCRVVAYDPVVNPDCAAMGVEYVSLRSLTEQSDILTLHTPLLPQTYHLINDEVFSWMKPGAMLINTSRGAIVDTKAAIRALKSGRLGYLGLDVYEEEAELFFRDLSDRVIQDDVFARLLTFPNVFVTAHQAFFTREALSAIARTTLQNLSDFERGTLDPKNVVTPAYLA